MHSSLYKTYTCSLQINCLGEQHDLTRLHTFLRLVWKYVVIPFEVPITTAADHILKYCYYLSEKIMLGFSCKSSAKQTIHKKCQVLLSLKNDNKIIVCYKFAWHIFYFDGLQ